MRWRILNMADITACPHVFDCLASIADVVTLPADQTVLQEQIGGFDAYYASLQVRLNREVLAGAKRLRAVATPSTGLDHIDLEEAKTRGVSVISLTHDIDFLNQITATAELAWSLILALARRLPSAVAAARAGN